MNKVRNPLKESCWESWGRYILAHTDLCFLLFCLAHLSLWTLLPTWIQPNGHLDVLECLAWGKEWQWGYPKHPPLHAWVTEIFFLPFGKSIWPGFLLSQLSIVLTFIAVWRLSVPLIGKKRALLSVLLLEGIYYYNFTSPEFNSNVSLLPLWAWTVYVFFRALKKESLLYWIFFGLMMGLSILSKYASLILGAVFASYVFFTSHGRRFLKKSGPYLSLLPCTLVLWPHIHWIISHDGQTLSYFLSRSTLPQTHWWSRFIFATDFSIAQLGALAGLLFLLWPFRKLYPAFKTWFQVQKEEAELPWKRGFLLYIGLGPLFLTLILSFVFNFRLRSMWATPFFTFLPVYLVSIFKQEDLARLFPSFLKKWVFISLLSPFAFGIMTYGQPYILSPKRVHFPGKLLGRELTEKWHTQTQHSLNFVIGDIWEAGNVGFYSPDRPSAIIDGDLNLSPWIDHLLLKESGAVIVWTCPPDGPNELPESFAKLYPGALIQPPLILPYETKANIPPAKIGWAIVPPRTRQKNFIEI